MNCGVEGAFVLGAGLGTRLGAITAVRPKPLVPVFGKPLVTFAFDHLIRAGVRKFVVNTHHLPEVWEEAFGAPRPTVYRGCPVVFRHEPVLLETGGGIRNVEDLFPEGDFLVHNGDVLADLDLERLLTVHRQSGNAVTLALRTSGGPLQVAWDAASGLVTDIRGELGRPGTRACLFTGLSVMTPAIYDFLPSGVPCSVIPAFLEMIRRGLRVGGVVLDEGVWFDLGTIDSYREIHALVAGGLRFAHTVDAGWPCPVAQSARLGAGARLEGWNAIGEGVSVGDGCLLENCILWPGAKTASRLSLRKCIVRAEAARSADSTVL